jgi:drug/metabolite transporter (DMT)-like permease
VTTTAIVLIIFSACIHAGWNLIAKREHPSAAFFWVATCAGVLLLSPLMVWKFHRLAQIPPEVWWTLVATGLCMAVYYLALAGAYRSGTMSIAYPLARSSPVIVVTVSAVLLGRAEQISAGCAAGAVMVFIGSFLLPMEHFRDFRIRNYWNACCLLGLLAAFGTAGYSILDDHGQRVLRALLDANIGTVEATMIYAPLQAVSACVWLGAFVLLRRGERESLRDIVKNAKGRAVLMGAGIWIGYALILVSMAFVENVSYVVGFRQLSVPLGAFLGVMVLREPFTVPKLVGVAIVSAGLLLVAVK